MEAPTLTCEPWAQLGPYLAQQTLLSRRMWQCFSRVCVIPYFKSTSYEIRFSHRDGAGHFELLHGDLLGIGACSHQSLYSHPEIFKFSDRYGRVRFLGLSIVTLLLGDAALAALAVAPEYVPGGYWFLLFASALGGLVGGGFRPQNSTTLNDTLLSFRTFCGHCSSPCVSCRLQRFGYKVCIL